MIFVGGGSLLSQAAGHALKTGLNVDAVCCPVGDPAVPKLKRLNVSILESNTPNTDLLPIIETSKVRKVFSINNKFILNDFLLSSGPEFFNVHNGLVQKYRGIGEVCIFAAICRGEREYGVTLHKLLPDQKVDAGPVVAQLPFSIEAGADFAKVMTRSLEACKNIFEENVMHVANNEYNARCMVISDFAFSYKDVRRLCASANPDRLAKASNLGIYRVFFPRLEQLIRSSTGMPDML
jgi:methionyl-tRNA formyltransferase